MARRAPRTVLITGASSGIGRALALAYGRRGAHVMALARREPELASLAREIEDAGGRASYVACDVSDPEQARAGVEKGKEVLGSLDLVVANAGVGNAKHAARVTLEDVTRTIDVNVRGAMATLIAAVPIMLDQKRGHLAGVSSLAGRRALPTSGAYNASKAALSMFLETLNLDLAPKGIDVTDVQPGFVATPMTANSHHPRPFQWDAEKAARVIADRLERAPRIIAFPWQLAALTRFSQLLPFPLYAWITRRAAGASVQEE